MKHCRHGLAGLLAVALTAASISHGLAAPGGTSFAEFRIDASGVDVVEQEISVALYRREDGRFQADGVRQYSCKLNRATRDASFFIQANTDGVWVTVDYLTDVDGDGTYELLVDDAAPVGDAADAQGGLSRPEGENIPLLAEGQTCILSAGLLLARSQLAVQDRVSGGACQLADQETAVRQRFPLCMVQLRHTGPEDGEEDVQTYYLQLYDGVLIPTDVSPSAWYYDAVEYVLEQGYFAGADDGRFLPDQELTRAQLAQVLWTVGGRQQAPAAQFFDVSTADWFYQAVAWCRQESLIAGYTSYLFAPNDPLSWEQMITILYRYAQRTGSSMRASADLTAFSDWEDVSSWAADSMRWAVTHGLVGGDGALRPGEPVTRAELASVLYAYEMDLSLYR